MRNSNVFDAWLDAFAVTVEYSDAVEFGKILAAITESAYHLAAQIKEQSGDLAMRNTADYLSKACEAWKNRLGN